jgi:AcrR family transcriptional regulator
MGRQKSNSTAPSREIRIVEAAIRVYAKLGAGQAGFSDIAKEARVPRPLVNYYFPTTHALQEAVVEVVLDSLKSAALVGLEKKWKDPLEAIVAFVDAYFDWAKKNRDLFSIWLYFYYLASFDPHFRKLNDRIRETGRDRIAALLYRAVEERRLRLPKAATAPSLALAIQSALTGGFVMAFTEGEASPAQTAEAVRRTIRALLAV